MAMKRHKPEQIVNLLRRIEFEIAVQTYSAGGRNTGV